MAQINFTGAVSVQCAWFLMHKMAAKTTEGTNKPCEQVDL